MKDPVIFLGINGVVSLEEVEDLEGDWLPKLEPSLVKNLEYILDKVNNCKIVLFSHWVDMFWDASNFSSLFKDNGGDSICNRVIDKTDHLDGYMSLTNVQYWIDDNILESPFVIIKSDQFDEWDDDEELSQYMITTSSEEGLTLPIANNVINFLNNNNFKPFKSLRGKALQGLASEKEMQSFLNQFDDIESFGEEFFNFATKHGFSEHCQKYVCFSPMHAVYFALKIKGADIKYCQEAACKDPQYAVTFVLEIPEADLKYCQEEACKSPYGALIFAKSIPGADIKYCQEAACKSPEYAIKFAKNIKGADIKYCQEMACQDPKHAFSFAFIPGADIKYCQEAACKSPEYALKFISYFIKHEDADVEYCYEHLKEDKNLQYKFFEKNNLRALLKKKQQERKERK